MKENNNGNDTNVGSIENSIEEDMKILEKFKNNEMQRDKLERDVRCGGWKIGDIYKCLELDNAIDNILSDYKRVLKENKELKQKIKEKTEENEWAVESYDCAEADYKQSQAIGAWSVLQELLEESEEK